ncbi:HGGxSTG domain-containing protein [Bacillus sp. NPDC094106]|uniref:HGGxSTG domain-containing protein n=1 Tax=Bacillus sp. NPDC094106 TaxID=3363949 RepID=UPI0038055AE5
MEKQVCGAMTRKGTPCQKVGIGKNGRCRLHGGKSTGPKDKAKHSASLRGNKNALKTGEHESIYYDTLLEDEKSLYDNMSTDCMES